mmetsp:Transcript_35304/g.40776  ORF Transcript_35304/g.40776 Transcript_35304/m.40776 type:complete len:281 (-) Transcript_35304:103-945(-)
MGISGTDVCKEASDIIILDDNFASVVKSIQWGRFHDSNIQKFVYHNLTSMIVAFGLVVTCSLLLKESPLRVSHLMLMSLLVNPALLFSLTFGRPNLIARVHPFQRNSSLIVPTRISKQIVLMAVYQLAVLLLLVFAAERFVPEDLDFVPRSDNGNIACGRSMALNGDELYRQHVTAYGPSRHFTIVLAAFVALQAFNSINADSVSNSKSKLLHVPRSRMFWLVFLGVMCGLFVVIQFVPGLVDANRHGLTSLQWGVALAIGLSALVADRAIRVVLDVLAA